MEQSEKLAEAEGRLLVRTARAAITEKFSGAGRASEVDPDVPRQLMEPRGAFVTLTKRGALRGCIGNIVAREPLIEEVRRSAVNAAFQDPRFPPLRDEELGGIKIEVSVLTEPVLLEYRGASDLLEKLESGIDGVIIRRGSRQATFLPQVWEQLPDKKTFLSHLCMKAGLPADAWSAGNLEVFTYRVQAFEEN